MIRDFKLPLGADYVVTIEAKDSGYALFFEAFLDGKLRHVQNVGEAKMLTEARAEEVVDQIANDYRCAARIERVSANDQREVLPYRTLSAYEMVIREAKNLGASAHPAACLTLAGEALQRAQDIKDRFPDMKLSGVDFRRYLNLRNLAETLTKMASPSVM
jgi:hypothetical protein